MKKQYKIGIIGTGNLAYFLAKKLMFSAFPISAIYGRDIMATRNLANSVDAIAFKDLAAFANSVDVIFLAVNDDAIATIAASLQSFSEKIVIHLSGTKPLEVLNQYFEKSGVFWPIYSINRLQIPEHRNIPIIINASRFDVQECLSNIASEITNHYEVVPEAQRNILHLMAVMTNNFMNHLGAVAQSLGKEKEVLFEWVIPIIQQTAERMQAPNIGALQTGPAIRNDQSTMNNHLSLLASHPEWQLLYTTISQSIIDYHNNKQ